MSSSTTQVSSPALLELVELARDQVSAGCDGDAIKTWLAILQIDHTHHQSLIELGRLALAAGKRAAARTSFLHAAQYHKHDLTALVTLGNMAVEDRDYQAAQIQYARALDRDPECVEALQGMARVLSKMDNKEASEIYWERGFRGHGVVDRHFKGVGRGVDVLYFAAARGGNVRLRQWMDDRQLAITVIYADYFDLEQPLPPHALLVNAIGDADLVPNALRRAAYLASKTSRPILNDPSRVMHTGRADIAARCREIPDLTAPEIKLIHRADILPESFVYPFLLRSPGYHTGENFLLVERPEDLTSVLERLPGEHLLAIQYLDARGADGMSRKYRVMFVGGEIYPLHLAISCDWKVHYFSANMEENEAYREEERRFLENMSGVLGGRAMMALEQLRMLLGLDYAGCDFGLAPDGSILLFEANASMTINEPPADDIWSYRRRAVMVVQSAVKSMMAKLSGTKT